jgi:hypothetical protein
MTVLAGVRRLLGFSALAVAVGTMAGCAGIADRNGSAGAGDVAEDGKRASLGMAVEVTIAEDLEHLVALSDAIVVGTVVDVQEGRKLQNLDGPVDEEGADEAVDGHDPHSFVDVFVRVDELLYGEVQYVDLDARLIAYEEGFGVPPTSSLPIDRGVYFLTERPEVAGAPPNYYHLTTSQGRFVFGEDGALLSNELREWEAELAGLDSESLIGRVREAIDAVEASPSPSSTAEPSPTSG